MTIDVRAAGAVLRELPDAMRPAWGARTWAGTFGSKALRAEVTAMDTALTLSAGGVTGTSKVTGRVLGQRSGLLDDVRSLWGRREVVKGKFGHTLHLHDGGRLEAHHTVLKLARDSRRTGFGSGFVDHGRARYGAAGVDDVGMFAGMSVGGYAWARQGLELVTTEVDDAARTLDRGRQLAAIVDSSRGWLDLSGRIPHVGRRITQAQHAELAPRLVRGDVLPPNALTSMEELAAIPDLGRSVLLNRMWKGTAEIDRIAPWYARNGADAAAHAAAGVSWRSRPEIVAAESVAAAQRIASKLPAAADPFRASEVFARHLSGAGSSGMGDAARGARAVLRVGLDDATPSVQTTIPLRTAAGRGIVAHVTWDGTKLVATEKLPFGGLRDTAARQALDAAWRELGVDQVRSGWTGIRRSLAPR